MTTRPAGRALTTLTAVLLALAACTAKEDTTTMPTATLADTQAHVQTVLSAITSELRAAAPSAGHDPAQAKSGPMPCGESGPQYQVTATDQVLLDGPRHRATLAGLRDRLQRAGYTITSLHDFADGIGGELNVRDSDGYTATISSGKDNHGLAIIIASPCFTTPDGRYPG